MVYNWKKFDAVNQRIEHRITVTGSGYIGFPTKFYNDNQIRDYKYVVLFYSEPEKAVGVKFTNEEEKGVLKIHHSKTGQGGSVVARNFFRANNLDYKVYRGRYEYKKETFEGIGELCVFQLRERINTPAG